jgi:pyrroloquinoline quinone biosynthesis protein E
LHFENVKEKSLAEIWQRSEAFQKFRGKDWMKEPCKSCDRRSVDFGGCRCQAFLLADDAALTDPVCCLSPQRAKVDAIISAIRESSRSPDASGTITQPPWLYRPNPA